MRVMSCLVTGKTGPSAPKLRGKFGLAEEYTAAAWHNHAPADITSFFAGLELVGPGVTEAQTWRAWMPQPVLQHREGHVLAGVARRQA
jgi:S-adenosyl methyltransferase